MSLSLWESLSRRAQAMAENAFAEIKTAKDWEKARPERHTQFMRSLGLHPLPEKCDPKIRDYGELKGEGFTARKIGYQILPDCWGSGTIYYPEKMSRDKVPGVLYVCGHNTLGSCRYQYHAIMWARRGYVCLIIDTIEQNDNPGEHCGLHLGHYKNWLSMGYSAAGGETFNAMRGLDVLAADERVAADRLGVTGVSGGGACSFHLAAADERIKAVSTLCGICSPYDAVGNWHVVGHCDCMFPINMFRRDISEYAALIAPRAVQFCSAIHDSLFHPEESRGLAERTRHVYELLGKTECWNLVEDPGPHGDHPAFDEATATWFDRHLFGEERPSVPRGTAEFPEREVSVFNGVPPAPNRLEWLPQWITLYGTVQLPQHAGEWDAIRQDAVARLRAEVPGLSTREEEASQTLELNADWRYSGELDARFTSLHKGEIDGMTVWMQVTTPAGAEKKIVLAVGSEGEYVQPIGGNVRLATSGTPVHIAALEPRIAGGNLPPETAEIGPAGSRMPPIRKYMMRAMLLNGTTPAMDTFKDIGVAINTLRAFEDTARDDIYLYGRGESGVAALYRAILDERVKGVVVEDVPGTHRDGGPMIGILRAFDIHHACGLVAPRKIALVNPGHKRCMWFERLYDRIGCPQNFLKAGTLQQALEFMLERNS